MIFLDVFQGSSPAIFKLKPSLALYIYKVIFKQAPFFIQSSRNNFYAVPIYTKNARLVEVAMLKNHCTTKSSPLILTYHNLEVGI